MGESVKLPAAASSAVLGRGAGFEQSAAGSGRGGRLTERPCRPCQTECETTLGHPRTPVVVLNTQHPLKTDFRELEVLGSCLPGG